MIRFHKSLHAFGSPEFNAVLKEELEATEPALLPLQQGVTQGSYCSDTKFNAMIISASEENNMIHARAGIFYSSIIAGCNCADDPTPVEEQNEYCEVKIMINKSTAETMISLL